MSDYSELNDAQREAVSWEGGPLLVLAGPGSGKTQTIVKRISYLLNKGIQPEKILVITFTREAAASMRKRFLENSKGFLPVNFGTFHSVFYHILKESHFIAKEKLISQNEKLNLMIPIVKCYSKGSGEEILETGSYREDALALLASISYFKNTCNREETLKGVPVSWQNHFWNIYREYEQARSKGRGYDFDDILYLCRKLLKENKIVRETWQNRFSHILIDEFQDINPVQYEILKLLSSPPHHILAVGDDDQSIYGFRGSSPKCLRKFEEEYRAGRICLDLNYRSRKKIIDASMMIMEEAQNRYVKQLKTGRMEREEGFVGIRSFEEKEQEYQYLLEKLHQKEAEKEMTAVLFRTNSAMQGFAAMLHRKGLPYRMKERSKSIYEHFIVKDIMAYLLLAEGEKNREYLLRIMNKPCRFISREVTEEEEAYSKGMVMLKKQLCAIRGLSLPLAITYILKAAGYERYLRQISAGKAEMWKEWQELIEWLKTESAQYQTAGDWKEAQWLFKEKLEREWEENSQYESTREEEEEYVIQLMTVHASKGLEFESVFIPDCNEGVFPYGHMSDSATVEEERRILYVAMTRAKTSLELLYLTGTKKSPRLPSRFINSLLYSSSSTNSSNSQLSKYSSKASDTFSNSSSSEI